MSRLALIAILGFTASANAAGESYMSLVGNLYAGVEMPRLALQLCGTAQPQSLASAGEQYESWRERNAAFLANAQKQFERANARLKAEGFSLDMADAAILQQLRGMDTRMLCSSFGQMLVMKDRQISVELSELLAVVTQADEVLSKRDAR